MDEGTFGRVVTRTVDTYAVMPTLLLSSRGTLDSIKLRQAAIELGWSVERLIEVEQIDKFKGQSSLVIFGEAIFARLVAKSLRLNLLQTPLNWLAQLPYSYLQRHLVYTTLAEARLQNAPRFIKPAGEKSFQAKVYTTGNLLPAEPNLAETTPVFVIEPVIWELEFRCFVLEREPQAISIYKREGQLARDSNGNWIASDNETREALKFCLRVVSNAQPDIPPAFVLDVGVIKNRGWAVIETNPAWASGIYGCNPAGVLRVLQRSCRSDTELTSTDAQWVL